MRRVCSDFDVARSGKSQAGSQAGLWKCSLLKFFFAPASPHQNCRLAEQKHENESSTRHGQRNYHIVSQLVRRGKCMQQFINHDAPYGRGAVRGREG